MKFIGLQRDQSLDYDIDGLDLQKLMVSVYKTRLGNTSNSPR